MHGPDGTDYDNRIVYTEVLRPERLAYNHSTDIDNDPRLFTAVIIFDDADGDTLVTLKVVLSSEEQYNQVVAHGAVEGGKETLDRLEEHLSMK